MNSKLLICLNLALLSQSIYANAPQKGSPDFDLLVAAASGDKKKVEAALGRGAKVNATTSSGQSALMLVVNEDFFIEELNVRRRAPAPEALAITKLLLDKGTDKKIKDAEGYSALYYAILSKNLDVTKALVSKDNIKEQYSGKETPLSLATKSESKEIVTHLLTVEGVNLDSQDDKGRTPLMEASSRHNDAIVGMLLKKGARQDLKDKGGKTALELTVKAWSDSLESQWGR